MKSLMTSIASGALAAALVFSVTAANTARAEVQTAPQAAETLKDVMGQMGDNMKVLVDALIKNKPVQDATLRAAADALPGLAVRASKYVPDDAFDDQGHAIPVGATEVAKYRDLMTKLIAGLTELNQAVKAGDKAGAKAVLLTKVAPIQKEGHSFFRPQD